MATQARVTLYSKTPYLATSKEGAATVDQVQLAFGVTADELNKEWAKYTPSLNIQMTVTPEVADQFEQGSAYRLTFEKE